LSSGKDGPVRLQLPDKISKYSETPEFDETTVPAKLTRAHRTKASTWSRLVVSAGTVEYVIPGPLMQSQLVSAKESIIIEPAVEHFVRCPGKVSFRIEFYRET
jgi:tellurite resistance-related uncharacterized protein